MGTPRVFHLMWSENSDFQELPLFILKKKAVVNVINNDQRSFGYSILSAKYYQVGERNKRIRRSITYDRLFNAEHLNNLPYPVSIPDMEKYEESLNLNINVLTFSDEDGRVLTPIYISKKKFNQSSIDLLYWSGHFAWIRNRSRLLALLSKGKRHLHYCIRCFSHFNSERKLNIHEGLCFKSKNMASINPTSRYYGFPKLSFPITIGFPNTTSISSTNNSTYKNGFPQNTTGRNDTIKRGVGHPTKESTILKSSKSSTSEWVEESNGPGCVVDGFTIPRAKTPAAGPPTGTSPQASACADCTNDVADEEPPTKRVATVSPCNRKE